MENVVKLINIQANPSIIGTFQKVIKPIKTYQLPEKSDDSIFA